jgi:tetratricopeptide (TPR) repeat protein
MHDAVWRRGEALFGLGRYAEAERAFMELRPMLAALHGADGFDTLRVDRDLAIAARALGRDAEAEHEYGEILARLRRHRNPEAERLRLSVRIDLISALNDLDRAREAYLVARDAIAEPVLSEQEVTQQIRLLHNGAQAARASGYPADAAAWHLRAVETAELKLGVGHLRTARTAAYAGQSLAAAGREREALAMLSRVIAGQEAAHNELHPELARLIIERAAISGVSAEGCEDLERASELIVLHEGSSVVTEAVRSRLREVAGSFGSGCD